MPGKHVKMNIGGKTYEGTLQETSTGSSGLPEWLDKPLRIGLILLILGVFIAFVVMPLFTPMQLNNAVDKFDIEVINTPKLELEESWLSEDEGSQITKINCSFDVSITNNSKYSADKLTGIMTIKNSNGAILYEDEVWFRDAGMSEKSQATYLVELEMNYSEDALQFSMNNFKDVEIWFEITEISFKGDGKTDLKKTESVLIKKYE